MISCRNRKYLNFILDAARHQDMIEWKKNSRHEMRPLPDGLYQLLLDATGEHFNGFDFLTVPAPSFHSYERYPIWEVAKQLSNDIMIPAKILFPNKSGKSRMHTFGCCAKTVQDIELESGLFVLILDDIYTTGHTMKVTVEAIAKKGSFACGLAIA